jgi:hypothetical protein
MLLADSRNWRRRSKLWIDELMDRWSNGVTNNPINPVIQQSINPILLEVAGLSRQEVSQKLIDKFDLRGILIY